MSDAPRHLPRGRHGLAREQVVESQRQRILLAVAEAMAVEGYVGTSVADVLERAGVSRETFYQQFASKRDCFLTAFDVAADMLLADMERRLDAPGEPLDRVEAALSGYLDTIVANPMFARLFLVEAAAAGPGAIERRAAVQRRIVTMLAATLGLRTAQERFACELVVAGVGALVVPPLVAGDLPAITRLRRPVLAHVRDVLGDHRSASD